MSENYRKASDVRSVEKSPTTVKEQSKTVKWETIEERAWRWCSSANTTGPRNLLLGPRSDHYDGYEKKNDHHQHPCRRKIRERERQIKLYNDRNSTPLMILYPMPLLDCFVNPASVTYLSDLFLSETWGTRAKNDLFYLWRLLLLDRRICTSPCHLWINLYGSTDLALIKLVKIQTPSSLKLIWDRLTEEGRGADTRENAWKR